jgi:hypothetical protein
MSLLQFESALKRKCKGDFFSLVWIPPGLTVEDVRQQTFVDNLRSDTRIQHGADLLETPFEDLDTQIHELLERYQPPPADRVKPPHSCDGHISVYLICDQRDVDNAAPIADALIEHCEVFLPVFQGDEEAVRKDHAANLRNCDGLLIYYGAANELWLRCQQRELLKRSALGGAVALRAMAILVAPPKTQQKDRVRTHEVLVIHLSDPFSPDCLAPFLAELRQEARSTDR